MADSNDPAIEYLRGRRGELVERLRELLRIPSVSAQPAHSADCRRAAEFIAGYLNAIGVRAEVVATAGQPAVIGVNNDAGPRAPRVLLYGHYDVQPVEPIEQWSCDPFAAELRQTDMAGRPAPEGGVLVARGSADNKGQHMAMLAGVEAVLKTAGRLPVNLKVVIEGEEEVTSPNLAGLIRQRKDELACDIVVLADGSLAGSGRPTIAYSARGIVYSFVTVRGPKQDLHSGVFGGVASNPANGLARLIAGLHDATGRVTLDGFYDGVDETTDRQRAELANLPGKEADLAGEAGVAVLGGGESGRQFNERRWFRPSCDVNGFGGGYQGPGSKTIIPAEAMAKVSFRLVGRQNPVKVAESFRRYLEANCPRGLNVQVQFEHFARPFRADRSQPAFAAMADAIRAASGAEAVWVGGGGTLPILADLKDILGADSVFIGLARTDSNLHSPNEQFNVSDFHLGAELSAHFWPRLAGQAGR